MPICRFCGKSKPKGGGKGSITTHEAAHKAQHSRKKKVGTKNEANKKLLGAKDCLKLCSILAKIFKFTKEEIRNDERPILDKYDSLFYNKKTGEYKFLPFPKVPNTLSEPIIIHLLKNKKLIPELANYEFHKGSIQGNKADISAVYKSSIKTIQAKSTGEADFITFGAKDMGADYFIWLRFRNAFVQNNFSELSMVIIKKPRKHPKLFKWTEGGTKNKLNFNELKTKNLAEMLTKKINLYSALK